MIKSLTVINPSNDMLEITLTELMPDHGLLIREIQGLGPVKANINTTPLVTADGTIYNSARLDERNIVIDFIFNCLLIEDARLITYKYFPIKQMVSLIIKTDHREVMCSGYVESNEPNIFSDQESAQISIICPDPFFYDVSDEDGAYLSFSTVEAGFEFPFSNESLTDKLIEFGTVISAAEKSIYYAGDSPTGVTCMFHFIGPVGGKLNVYNTSKNEKLSLDVAIIKKNTGIDLDAGMDVIVNTQPGRRSATLIADGKEYNILNAVDRDSTWFMIFTGDNLFSFGSDTGVENIQFTMYSQIVYEGV